MPQRVRVAILDDYQAVAMDLADWATTPEALEVVAFHDHIDSAEQLVERLRDFDVVVAMRERTAFPASLIRRLPRLRLLVTTGERNAAIDLPAAEAAGVVVCGTRMLVTPTVELTWGLIHSLTRRIPFEDAALRAGAWQRSVGYGLEGTTLGLVGLGRIGERVARVALAFDMRVIAWSQNLTREAAARVGATLVSKDELFRTADVVSVHVRLSDRTRGLVGDAELAVMKPGAVLVNTSRAEIVDEDALVRALTTGHIGGAALDVYPIEPLPADHRLRDLPNTVLTPHIGYVTRQNLQLCYRDALEDIQAFLAGRPIRVLRSG